MEQRGEKVKATQLIQRARPDLAMKQSSAVQGEQRIQQTSQAFGRFLRQAIEQNCPHEFASQLDALETTAQTQLHSALSNANGDDSLYRQAVAAALTTVREAKQQSADQSFVWVEWGDTKLPADPQQLAQTVQEALAQLPDNHRRAVNLHLAGMTMSEIGELLGWSEKKTRQHVERGVRALRKMLHAAGIEYEID